MTLQLDAALPPAPVTRKESDVMSAVPAVSVHTAVKVDDRPAPAFGDTDVLITSAAEVVHEPSCCNALPLGVPVAVIHRPLTPPNAGVNVIGSVSVSVLPLSVARAAAMASEH